MWSASCLVAESSRVCARICTRNAICLAYLYFTSNLIDSSHAGMRISGSYTFEQVKGEQFVEAIAEALEPRMRLTGQMDTLEKFKACSLLIRKD
jgi:hypothetical protein